jgi:putative transposase
MVSPSRRRDAVRYLLGRHPVSERRACKLVGQYRSTQRYVAVPSDFEARLRGRMNKLAAQYPRWGYRRIWELLRQEGFAINKKRVERLWRLEGHKVPAKRQRRGQKAVGGRAGPSRLPIGRPLDAAQADEVIGAVTSFGGGTRLHLVA